MCLENQNLRTKLYDETLMSMILLMKNECCPNFLRPDFVRLLTFLSMTLFQKFANFFAWILLVESHINVTHKSLIFENVIFDNVINIFCLNFFTA